MPSMQALRSLNLATLRSAVSLRFSRWCSSALRSSRPSRPCAIPSRGPTTTARSGRANGTTRRSSPWPEGAAMLRDGCGRASPVWTSQQAQRDATLNQLDALLTARDSRVAAGRQGAAARPLALGTPTHYPRHRTAVGAPPSPNCSRACPSRAVMPSSPTSGSTRGPTTPASGAVAVGCPSAVPRNCAVCSITPP